MSTEHKLGQFISALEVLTTLPVMQLAQNKKLVSEVQQIVSSRNMQGILTDLANERVQEKYAALNQGQKKSHEDPELLGAYVDYQSAAYRILEKNADKKMTQVVKQPEIVAFNSIRKADDKSKYTKENEKIAGLKERTRFIEAYNSIFSDRGLQIRTANDPTMIQSFIDYSPYIWNYKDYLAIPTLAKTIDAPIDIATRKMPRIEFKDEELSNKMNFYLDRSRINEKIKKLLGYSAKSPRGALLVPIESDGQIRYNVFNDTQFTYAASQQYSRIDFQDTMNGVSQLFCLGNILQNEVTAHFLCPGFEPIFAIGSNRCFQLKEAAEAINIYLYTIKVLCVRAQILIQKSSGEGQNDTRLGELIRTTKKINSELSMSTAVPLGPDDTLDIVNNPFSTGFSEVPPFLKEFQGLLTGMIGDNLYGSQQAYQANNFNLNITLQNIHSEIQIPQIAPAIRYIVNTQLKGDRDFIKWKNHVDNFDVKFDSNYEMSEIEKVELDTKKIANIIEMASYPELRETFEKEKLWPKDTKFIEAEEKEPGT